MSQPADLHGEFTWSGSIVAGGGGEGGGHDVEAVLQRCQRLRLTGRLLLVDGERRAELLWMGGEIHESESGDTSQEIRRWQRGTFQASQLIPDLQGQLTGGVEISGELSLGQVQRIATLAADFRLSAELHLERATGDRAQVRFTLGKAESALIGGQAQTALQALSLLSVWHKGRYLLRLRPLFSQDAPEAPIFVEKRTTRGDFDVTGTIEVPVIEELRRRRGAKSAPPSSASSRGAPSSLSSDRTTQPIPPESVAEARGLAPLRSAVPTQVTPAGPEATRTALSVPPRPVWRKALAVGLGGGALAFALAFGVRFYLRQMDSHSVAPAPDLAPRPALPAAAPDLAPRAASPVPAPDLAPVAAAALAAPAPDLAQAAPRPPRSREAQALFERAMRMIVEARLKKAQEAIAQLQKLSPEDPDAATLDKQSRYELGRADLVVTGSGTVTICGHGYAAPHRLRLPAGLYLVDGEVITLRDGERREIEARPR